jgi:hypothetical protein
VAKTAEQILRDAADYIRAHGWTRGQYEDGDSGQVCMIGAMLSVGLHFGDPIPKEVYDVIGGGEVFKFNDHHCKSVRDAIAALEIAADLAA